MGSRRFEICGLIIAIGLISCAKPRPPAPSTDTTVAQSAPVNASETIRSCAGPSLCREDVLADLTGLEDVEDACSRHGGTFGSLRCARDGAVAKCVAGSEYGTVTVYAYDRRGDAEATIALVSKQCEAFEGSFEKMATR